MFFLNLSAAEFLTLFGALGGLVTALYLFDRAKRRKLVSTLQFWVHMGASEKHQSRRRMQDPWSLILQLLSLLLLLLAISRMQWGKRAQRGHDHVILVDTSSWSAAPASEHTGSVIEIEKREARAYLRTLNADDRAMLVSVNGQATPVLRFTRNHQTFNSALNGISPGFSATDLDEAVRFAKQALEWSGEQAGEIVYIGPQMVAEDPTKSNLPNLRVVPVSADRNNVGIVQLTAQQVESEPNTWKSLVQIKNFGPRASSIHLDMHFGTMAFKPRVLDVAPSGEITTSYTFTAKTAGALIATISPGGTLTSDDKASILLPQTEPPNVVVYSDRGEALRPLLAANRQFEAETYPTAQYTSNPSADVVVLDRFAPTTSPQKPTLWIDPPRDHAPIAVLTTAKDSLLRWTTGSSLESALRAKALHLPNVTTFQIGSSDETVASVPEGSAVVLHRANSSNPKFAVIGFDPAQAQLRFEVATPLLFADLLQWLDPAAFHELTLSADRIGLVTFPLASEERRGLISVIDDRGTSLPFLRRQNDLQVFQNRPGTVRIVSSSRERTISFHLPAVADHLWKASAQAKIGLPLLSRILPMPIDLWKWLAAVGGLGLLLEWFLFGRLRRSGNTFRRLRRANREAKQAEELVSK